MEEHPPNQILVDVIQWQLIIQTNIQIQSSYDAPPVISRVCTRGPTEGLDFGRRPVRMGRRRPFPILVKGHASRIGPFLVHVFLDNPRFRGSYALRRGKE